MLSSWGKCRELFALRYVDLLVPARAPRAPSYGTLFHRLVEGLWRDQGLTAVIESWRNELITAAVEQQMAVKEQYGLDDEMVVRSVEDQCNEIATECIELVRYYKKQVFDRERERYTPIFIEKTFEVPLVDRAGHRHRTWRLSGKWDVVLRDNDTGKVWLRDYKTTNRRYASDLATTLEMDTQPVAYTYASHYLATVEGDYEAPPPEDVPVWPKSIPLISGFELEIVRKKVPQEPELLKKGGLSKAQGIDTTPALYRQAIRRNNLSEADYSDVLEMLEKRGNSFHHRQQIPVGPKEIERWVHETRLALEDIRRVELHRDLAYRADQSICTNMYGKRCVYHDLCFGDAEAARCDFIVQKRHVELDETPAEIYRCPVGDDWGILS